MQTGKVTVENNLLGCSSTRCINSPGDDLMRGGGMGGGMMGGAAGAGLGLSLLKYLEVMTSRQ